MRRCCRSGSAPAISSRQIDPLTEDKQEAVLVDKVRQAKVEHGEGQDERRNDRVRDADGPDQERLRVHDAEVQTRRGVQGRVVCKRTRS